MKKRRRGDKPVKTKSATELKDYPKGPAKNSSSRKVKYNFGKKKNNSIMKTALIIGSRLIGSQLLNIF
jgi:hypothetical protein